MPGRDKGIAAAFARARGRDRRLATWMTRNHDFLLHELGTGRIEWAAPLLVFAALGLADDGGKVEITRDTASRTWRRVRAAVAQTRRAQACTRPVPGELVPGVRLIAPAPATMPVRASPASVIPVAAPIVGTPSGAEEATERISAVLAAMGALRVPLPSLPSHHQPPAPMSPAKDSTS